MKNIFDNVEKALEKVYGKADEAKDWVKSKLPESMKGFSDEKYPRLAKLKEDLSCVIYFTCFRVILTVVVLPVICIALPAVGLYKFIKSKLKSKEKKAKA